MNNRWTRPKKSFDIKNISAESYSNRIARHVRDDKVAKRTYIEHQSSISWR